MIYLKYLWYVLRHKWFVFVECVRPQVHSRTIGMVWRGLVHDISKLLPDEFVPYARFFYGDYPSDKEIRGSVVPESYRLTSTTKETVQEAFDLAWLKHIHRNSHHWQYWLLQEDDGKQKIIPMHYGPLKEMLADWIGAGRALGTPDTAAWYLKNKDRMIIDPVTANWIETQLGIQK